MAGTSSEPIRLYSCYLRQKYGCRVYRVAVDAGFSCPNRGGRRENAGCTYCDEQASRAPYLRGVEDLKAQVEEGIRFLSKRYGAELFMLYLQAFTNTFAPVDKLRSTYDYLLNLASFREFIVSTRPDCVSQEIAELLGEYREPQRDVWVELGLQSASDATLRRIKRGHTVRDFLEAYRLLKRYSLKVAVHLIFGLPGETEADIRRTVELVASLKPDGIKIHNLHVLYGTEMFEEYLKGELTVPSSRRHLEYTISAIERLPRQTVVMRLTCDTPRDRLAVPRQFWEKARFFESLKREMGRRKTYQGRLYMACDA